MRRLNYSLLVLLVFLCASLARAEWDSVSYHFTAGEENTVEGPDKACRTTRPAGSRWTASFGASNHVANLTGERIPVYSAQSVAFHDYNTASGHAGKSSHITFKIELSEPIVEAVWDIGPHGRNVVAPASLTARYSCDGETWVDAHEYPAGYGSDHDPPPVTLRFDPPTKELYLGWFAHVPQGTGWWLIGSTGDLTFTPAQNPFTEGPSSAADKPAPERLQAPRTIPSTFFGTTTHVNSDGLIELLEDLRISNVRVDFAWTGLEPARGQYNFDPGLWMLESADLGATRNLDQLVVLTRPPAWAVGDRETYPNDQSVAALEEFMFQIASKYKGRIRYWQAGNEPNMAVWRERFVPFLKAYYRGVKRADPENRVVLCGFAGVEHMHLDAVYRLGGKDYFDILGAHPYTRPAMPEEGGLLEKIRAIHAVMCKYGDSKPLWIDEIGWNGVEPSMLEYLRARFDGHRTYAVTEEDQARALARLYLIAATVPWIERVYFFHLHQEAAYTDINEQVDYYMGLFTPWRKGQIRPKDAYFAVETVIEVLSGSTYQSRIDTPPRVWALHFERGDEATIALWSLDDGVTMKIDDLSAVTSITSMVGTPVLIAKDALTLSGRPLYLKTERAKAEQLKQQIRRKSTRITARVGQRP